MADVNKISFARLNNQNWQIWKFRMEMMLTREELWYVIEDEKPETVSKQWTRDDKKARATIGLFIDDNQFGLVKNANSAKKFWDNLREYHEKNTVTSRVSLLKKLCSLNLQEGSDLENHLMVLDDLFDRLMNAGLNCKNPFESQ
ncbi:uncharacterized protein LOC134206054 [Armigeres subalbatus]|uniref:uncharacterized protein LOC134206054 n=1 Tax=Armigeres subalbatus TaxID=124917 RepID=UPI002ED250B8